MICNHIDIPYLRYINVYPSISLLRSRYVLFRHIRYIFGVVAASSGAALTRDGRYSFAHYYQYRTYTLIVSAHHSANWNGRRAPVHESTHKHTHEAAQLHKPEARRAEHARGAGARRLRLEVVAPLRAHAPERGSLRAGAKDQVHGRSKAGL